MSVVYFKRFRMQFDLRETAIPVPLPNAEINYLAWEDRLVTQHGMAKWESFRREMDVCVFPCLGDRDGCKQLMRDISRRDAFVPESTWLAMEKGGDLKTARAVGTIQGLRTSADIGAIQNIGVVPEYRGRGVGRGLILRCLDGFKQIGCRKAQLEVTIHNFGAIQLYESIGFRKVEIVFKIGQVSTA